MRAFLPFLSAGTKLSDTVSSIDIGVRDTTHVVLTNGTTLESAVGDVNAAAVSASKALFANGDFGSAAANAYAQKMGAAGAALGKVTASSKGVGTIGLQLDDAILQLTDPVAAQRKALLDAVDASYTSLKAQAQSAVDADLAASSVLARSSSYTPPDGWCAQAAGRGGHHQHHAEPGRP